MSNASAGNREQLGHALAEAHAGRLEWLDKLVLAAGYLRTPAKIESDVASRPGLDPALLRFIPTTQAAMMIGCSDRTLRNYCAGEPGLPQMPHQNVGGAGKYLVQTAVAYEFLLRHAKRHPKGLHPPAGWVSEEDAAKAVLPVAPGSEDMDPIERLEAVLRNPRMMSQLGHEQVRVLAAGVEVLRRKSAEDAKAAKRYDEDEVTKLLQAVGREWARQFVNWTPATADSLVAYLQEKFGVSLREINISSRELLLAVLNNRGDEILKGFNKYIEDQVKGVQLLKGAS
jgi:hypothetical protein